MRLHWLLLFICVNSIALTRGLEVSQRRFDAIYQFGDSLSDTGNLILESPLGASTSFARLPYGQNFHQHPTGRCSDGLLMVDYFAMFFHLPLLNPYLAKESNFTHGVNFAVAGATAMDASVLAAKNITMSLTKSSLSLQLGWFRSHLASICSNPRECTQKLRNAIVLMGEIGGNDYNYAFAQRKAIQEIYQLVPEVVQTIINAVKVVIKLGATRVVVPGNFPIGCVPIYLAAFKANDSSEYDEFNCLKGLNNFSKFHNAKLQEALRELQQEYPRVVLVYADYYYALRSLFGHAAIQGFDKDGLQKTCCGMGDNPYNYDPTWRCGSPGVPVCPDPSKRVSWDGIHPTQHAYKYMATWLLRHNLPALYN